jgi:hypothetical protein
MNEYYEFSLHNILLFTQSHWLLSHVFEEDCTNDSYIENTSEMAIALSFKKLEVINQKVTRISYYHGPLFL